MRANKLTAVWQDVRDSLWFVPAVLTTAAVVLAFLTVELDSRVILPEGVHPIWVYTGSSDGARGVLTAIASGLITVTGVVFSVTIVALQLASTQYTPRVLRNFTADRASQVVLGVFIGTFTYALLILRVVRGEEPTAIEDGEYFIPHLSVVVAVLLTLISIGFLIFFIDHLARSIQASVIIERVTKETLGTLERRVPEQFGRAGERDAESATPAAQGSVISALSSGYIQGIDQDTVFELLHQDAYTVRLEREVGDFILPGTVLATIWPATVTNEDDLAGRIRDAFILGTERTPYMDVERGVIELVDIAVKALSPSINDPTTAALCVDRLAEVLLDMALRTPPARVRTHPDNGGILIMERTDFERMVEVALDQVRHFGVGNPRFAVTMLVRLGELGQLLPRDARQPVARQAAAIVRGARRRIAESADLNRVEAAGERALHLLDVGIQP